MSNVLNPAIGSIFGGNDSAVARPFTSESIAWRDAVITNGGTVSLTQLIATDNLIYSLQIAGDWTPMDDAWVLVAENATQALTSLKQRRLGTAVNSPTFTIDRGYAFDGVSNYIDTGFIPSSHAVSMTVTSTRISVYERANVAGNNYAGGITFSSNRSIRIRPRLSAGSSASIDPMAQGGTFTLPAADSRGMTSGSRNGSDATTAFGYKNGVPMVRTVDPAGYGTSLPSTSVWIGGTNSSGALSVPRAATVGWLAVGAALTDAQELSAYNAVQTYMTTKGANV